MSRAQDHPGAPGAAPTSGRETVVVHGTDVHVERAHFELPLAEARSRYGGTSVPALLAGALAGLGAALAIPVFSLGPAPGRALFETSWRPGARLAVHGGEPVRPDQIPVGGVLTVFPDGDDSDPNAATLLVRVEPELLQLEADGATYAPEGFVAYSKICTHAGCPVGLYRAAQHTLICPCHQSEFDVLRGAVPISGPAARPLPQLPIRLEGDAFVAVDDYPEPVGPSFWNMGRA